MKKISFIVFSLVLVLWLSETSFAQEEEDCGPVCRAKKKAGEVREKNKEKREASKESKEKAGSAQDSDKKKSEAAKKPDKAAPAKGETQEKSGVTGKVKEKGGDAKDWTVDKGKKTGKWTKKKAVGAKNWTVDKAGNVRCNSVERRCLKDCHDDVPCQNRCAAQKEACLAE